MIPFLNCTFSNAVALQTVQSIQLAACSAREVEAQNYLTPALRSRLMFLQSTPIISPFKSSVVPRAARSYTITRPCMIPSRPAFVKFQTFVLPVPRFAPLFACSPVTLHGRKNTGTFSPASPPLRPLTSCHPAASTLRPSAFFRARESRSAPPSRSSHTPRIARVDIIPRAISSTLDLDSPLLHAHATTPPTPSWAFRKQAVYPTSLPCVIPVHRLLHTPDSNLALCIHSDSR